MHSQKYGFPVWKNEFRNRNGDKTSTPSEGFVDAKNRVNPRKRHFVLHLPRGILLFGGSQTTLALDKVCLCVHCFWFCGVRGHKQTKRELVGLKTILKIYQKSNMISVRKHLLEDGIWRYN